MAILQAVGKDVGTSTEVNNETVEVETSEVVVDETDDVVDETVNVEDSILEHPIKQLIL